MNSILRPSVLGPSGSLALLALLVACGSELPGSNDGGSGAGTTSVGGGGTSAGATAVTGGAPTGGVATGGVGTGGSAAGAGATTTGGVSGTGPGGSAGTPAGGAGGVGATGGSDAGAAGTPATGGMAGAGASGGGPAGAGGTSGASGAGGTGGGVVWPNEMSKANSDPWIQQNHDRITQLRPKVLVIDLENTATAMTRIGVHIAALKEASSFHKYKDANAQPMLAYELVKVVQATKGSRIDYQSWNTQAFADSNIQLKDPANPSGPNLTLCGLFEQGVINEVWCMASSNPKCGETQESKQAYNADGTKIANRFSNVSNGDSITNLGCKVTARITDFNSGRGSGCHQHAMGHAWERYMDSNAIPMLGKQAKRFLNWDLNTRVAAPFSNFYNACNSNATQLTDCIVWDSQIHARSGPSASRSFDIPDMSAGCGNAHFYPNTTGTYSYDANMPDPTVLTSCENYGLKNGTGGKDLTTTYNNAMTDMYYGRSSRTCPANQPACDDDCGGHGTTYLYQNFPSYGTLAKNDDNTSMQNWWVYLFY